MERYFDYAATSPMSREALAAFTKAAEEFYGNTSSAHDFGTEAQSLLEHSRNTLASKLDVEQEGVYFTSGGTESNWIGLEALMGAGKGNHIVVSAAEHSSVRRVVDKMEREGAQVTWVPFTAEGVLDLEVLASSVTKETAVVSVQLVNSDLGTIQPLEEVYRHCREKGVLLHSDFVQAFGKINLKKVARLADSFSLSAHKIGGPKGVGAVYIRPTLSFSPIFHDVTHESGVRPGTVNTPGVASFIVAADEALAQRTDGEIRTLKNKFVQLLGKGFSVVGNSLDSDIPIIGLTTRGVPGQWMMLEGNRRGFAFSTGSACQTGHDGTLTTLDAMGMTKEQGETFIRVSFHHSHSEFDIVRLAECLNTIASEHRSEVSV
ncbi:IscS subfamily cysteine desulfurase [Halobacillus locisalis]|uniref:IscS subfamily cysteine desulfurase n=1 Tax=Halobacillus locisalis TaxID=220753 RepID=A0A838CXL2_9BACI|nr:IscS subfamily cysteine desulfurase [Halobacillus locisalis]MBA2176663.1 IscS subfamily cysteine desulfurase [Halobacillus locisalis]